MDNEKTIAGGREIAKKIARINWTKVSKRLRQAGHVDVARRRVMAIKPKTRNPRARRKGSRTGRRRVCSAMAKRIGGGGEGGGTIHAHQGTWLDYIPAVGSLVPVSRCRWLLAAIGGRIRFARLFRKAAKRIVLCGCSDRSV